MLSRWLLALLAAGPVLAGTRAPVAPEREEAQPPALGARALSDELGKAMRRRYDELKAVAAEREAAVLEKAALEKLRGEVEQARSALREETARLQKLVDRAPGCEKPPAQAGASEKQALPREPAGPQLDALAKTIKSMKAEQAAPVMRALGKPLAVALLRRLKPADAGALLDKLETPLVTELVQGLAQPQEARP